MPGFSLIIAIVLILLLWGWLQRRSGGRRSGSGRAGFRGGSHSERQLVKLAGRQPAQRLIEQVQRRNPDRPRRWCADKALFDWERDRRY